MTDRLVFADAGQDLDPYYFSPSDLEEVARRAAEYIIDPATWDGLPVEEIVKKEMIQERIDNVLLKRAAGGSVTISTVPESDTNAPAVVIPRGILSEQSRANLIKRYGTWTYPEVQPLDFVDIPDEEEEGGGGGGGEVEPPLS